MGLEQREAGVPLICLETALPARFEATIREALDRDLRPAGAWKNISAAAALEVMDADAESKSKAFIAAHV